MPKPLPVIAASIAIASSAIAHAQWWLDVPANAIPRTPAGEPDLAAPAPRLTGGRPDFTGLWEPIKTYSRDLADDLIAPDAVPFQPWAKAARRGARGRLAVARRSSRTMLAARHPTAWRRARPVEDRPDG